jgi:hypothetical protein
MTTVCSRPVLTEFLDVRAMGSEPCGQEWIVGTVFLLGDQ